MSYKERFYARTALVPSGCIEWTGGRSHGYGVVRFRGASRRAHQVAWELERGSIPKGRGYHGTCVLHSCDNRMCVNVEHLHLGTNADNTRERDERGRRIGPRGSRANFAKLTAQQVVEIRAIGNTQSFCATARMYGVGSMQVGRIIRGESWNTKEAICS